MSPVKMPAWFSGKVIARLAILVAATGWNSIDLAPSAAETPKPPRVAKAAPSKSKPARGAAEDESPPARLPPEVYSTGYDGRNSELVRFVNDQVRQGWVENNVTPSPPADDAEWVRRVSLDIVGRIPDLETAQSFLADKAPDKRARLIDSLLADTAYARHWTAIWTNNLIGRSTPRDINRPALEKFLRESFARNRGWDAIVSDLLTAEGSSDKNGATNFLLAHLNDGAVPATAISSRLFLGVQVQCTQCHNHPFNSEAKQNLFWEFNSFFKQVRTARVRKYNQKTGRMDVDHLELLDADFDGPVFFERRTGLMEVAYPKFNGVDVSPDAQTDRRRELAKLITAGERTQLADAMVNRMWGHFFGFGFTRPIEDMGPHKPPSHPELLEQLSVEFVKSGYDLQQLIRACCNSEAYNLTSRAGAGNSEDNPSAGKLPFFSRMYLKALSAEQLYDSLIAATGAHQAAGGDWEQAQSRRQEWLEQFIQTFGTDENDEANTFDGTIPQALMMMNGELMQNALAGGRGGVLHKVLHDKAGPIDKVKLLYLATLTRVPSAREIDAANRILRYAKTPTEPYQDLYWALLNSNEFIINH
ncbi:MAG: DUF1549 domain-containing protein [Planctomycetaceae bacterium]